MVVTSICVEREYTDENGDAAWCEIELRVEALVSRFRPGRYSGPPENCFPDEGGGIEEMSITWDGVEVYAALTRAELLRADAAVYEQVERDNDESDRWDRDSDE